MYNSSITYSYTLPSPIGEAYISLNKNRLKLYGNNVYLKDKQEFEIELFNPSGLTKLAKIFINGKAISTSGIVLKPGQRVYLERFIDFPKKFLFETYEVEDSQEAKQAIANNGDIEIQFYDEKTPVQKNYLYENPWDYKDSCMSYFSKTASLNADSLKNPTTGGQHVNSLTRSSAAGASASFDSLVETGRVESGSTSGQRFKYYNGKFNTWATNIVKIKILPVSQKPVEIKDLAEYCTNCGIKNKKGNYKFCPKCGTKFE